MFQIWQEMIYRLKKLSESPKGKILSTWFQDLYSYSKQNYSIFNKQR